MMKCGHRDWTLIGVAPLQLPDHPRHSGIRPAFDDPQELKSAGAGDSSDSDIGEFAEAETADGGGSKSRSKRRGKGVNFGETEEERTVRVKKAQFAHRIKAIQNEIHALEEEGNAIIGRRVDHRMVCAPPARSVSSGFHARPASKVFGLLRFLRMYFLRGGSTTAINAFNPLLAFSSHGWESVAFYIR